MNTQSRGTSRPHVLVHHLGFLPNDANALWGGGGEARGGGIFPLFKVYLFIAHFSSQWRGSENTNCQWRLRL